MKVTRVRVEREDGEREWITLEEFARLFVARETLHGCGPGVSKDIPIEPSQPEGGEP